MRSQAAGSGQRRGRPRAFARGVENDESARIGMTPAARAMPRPSFGRSRVPQGDNMGAMQTKPQMTVPLLDLKAQYADVELAES